MPGLRYHIFVCENDRDASDPRGCCAAKGGEAIREAFKEEIARRGLKGVARANKAGCLDQCKRGPAVVVYPEGIWYTIRSAEEARQVVAEHVEGDKPVEALRMENRG